MATPGYPVTPLLFLVPVLIVIVLRIVGDPVHSLTGLFVVVLGIPVSGLMPSGRRPADAGTVGPSNSTELSSVSISPIDSLK